MRVVESGDVSTRGGGGARVRTRVRGERTRRGGRSRGGRGRGRWLARRRFERRIERRTRRSPPPRRGAPPPRTFHRRDGKKEAWGQAGAEEMEAFLAAEGSWIGEEVPRVDRRARRRTPSRGGAGRADATLVAGARCRRLANAADAAVAKPQHRPSPPPPPRRPPPRSSRRPRPPPSRRVARRTTRGCRRRARRARFVRKLFPSRLRRFAPRDERTRRWAIARGARC